MDFGPNSSQRRFLTSAQSKSRDGGFNGMNYKEIATELGLSEDEAFEITQKLMEAGIVGDMYGEGDFTLTKAGLKI